MNSKPNPVVFGVLHKARSDLDRDVSLTRRAQWRSNMYRCLWSCASRIEQRAPTNTRMIHYTYVKHNDGGGALWLLSRSVNNVITDGLFGMALAHFTDTNNWMVWSYCPGIWSVVRIILYKLWMLLSLIYVYIYYMYIYIYIYRSVR